jgi:hypothetical protein
MQRLRLILIFSLMAASGCSTADPEFPALTINKEQPLASIEGLVFEVNHLNQAFQLAVKNKAIGLSKLPNPQYTNSIDNCGRYEDNVDVPIKDSALKAWEMSRALGADPKTVAAATSVASRAANEDFTQEIYFFWKNSVPVKTSLPKNHTVSCMLWNQKAEALIVIHSEKKPDFSSFKYFIAKVIGHGASISNFQVTAYSLDGKILLDLPLMLNIRNDWQRIKLSQ